MAANTGVLQTAGDRGLDFGGFHSFLFLPRARFRLGHIFLGTLWFWSLLYPLLPTRLVAAYDDGDLCLPPC